MAPALHHAIRDEFIQVTDKNVARAGLDFRVEHIRATQVAAETPPRRFHAMQVGRDIDARSFLRAAVFLAQLDVVDPIVFIAVHQVAVFGQVGQDDVVADFADQVRALDVPVVGTEGPVLARFEHQAGRELAAAFGFQLVVAVAARTPVVGANRVVVVLGFAVHGIGQGRRLAVDGGTVQVRHRRRTEALAGRGAQQHLLAGHVGQADFRTQGAAHLLVMVIAARELRLPLLGKWQQQFAVDGLHIAAVAGGHAALGGSIVVDVIAHQQCRWPELRAFTAHFATHGQRHVAAAQRHQRARCLEVQRIHGAARMAHLVVHLDAVEQRLAFRARWPEGIDAAIGDTFQQLVVQDIAMGILVLDHIDAVVQAHVVIPADERAGGADHEALALAGQLAGAHARLVQAHAQFQLASHRLAILVERRIEAGIGQLRHLAVIEIADHARRRTHVMAARAAQRHLRIQLVIVV